MLMMKKNQNLSLLMVRNKKVNMSIMTSQKKKKKKKKKTLLIHSKGQRIAQS